MKDDLEVNNFIKDMKNNILECINKTNLKYFNILYKINNTTKIIIQSTN